MSTHTCIYGNEDLNNLSNEEKTKLYNALLFEFKPHLFSDSNITKTRIKNILSLFYILDCINEKVSDENKMVIRDVENDKRGRELLKEYLDTNLKLYETGEKLKEIEFECELNPLRYTCQNYEEYNDKNVKAKEMFSNAEVLYALRLCEGDILSTEKVKKIKEIINKIESED